MRSARKVLFALVMVAAASSLSAQATTQKPKPFVPQSGQAGKDVVWVPTPQPLVEKMLDLAAVTPKDFVMDLGSGDGRTVITAAKRGARALGIEYNPDMVELSRQNAAAAGVSKLATFQQADLFETDFSKADVVTMFLLPSINMRLRPVILKMKPGTRIVSNTFTMEDWEADETASPPNCDGGWCTALLWIVPAQVEGAWTVGSSTLNLTQKFQMLTGTLGSQAISAGRLRGTNIVFNVGDVKYSGTVSGNTISGTMTGGRTGNWTATRK
jgi:SAM-dependent methyltransferase